MSTARKRFGQHFLQDQQIIRRIIQAITPLPDDHIIEIGPGRGALTAALFNTGCDLSLIEIDRDLARLLKSRFPGVNIYNEDVLKTDLKLLLSEVPPSQTGSSTALSPSKTALSSSTALSPSKAALPKKKSRIVGNLPYNISTPLLFRLFDCTEQIQDMHFMLQREVVDRLCALPSTSAYGRLTIMAQYHCRADKIFEVPPEAFEPEPRVQSAVIKLSPRDDKPLADPLVLGEILKQVFSQRRKTLRNAMKIYLSETELQDCGIDPGLRPENLDINQYVSCAVQVARKVARNGAATNINRLQQPS